MSRDPGLLTINGPDTGAAKLDPLIGFMFLIVSLLVRVHEVAGSRFGFDGKGDEDCFRGRESGVLMKAVCGGFFAFLIVFEAELVGTITASSCCCRV
jgi:hypothetical protein